MRMDRAELYYEPRIVEASFVPNPAVEGQPVTVRVLVLDVPAVLTFCGEFQCGEVAGCL